MSQNVSPSQAEWSLPLQVQRHTFWKHSAPPLQSPSEVQFERQRPFMQAWCSAHS